MLGAQAELAQAIRVVPRLVRPSPLDETIQNLEVISQIVPDASGLAERLHAVGLLTEARPEVLLEGVCAAPLPLGLEMAA